MSLIKEWQTTTAHNSFLNTLWGFCSTTFLKTVVVVKEFASIDKVPSCNKSAKKNSVNVLTVLTDLQLAEYSLRTCRAGCKTLKKVVLFLTMFIVTWRAPVSRALTHSLRSANEWDEDTELTWCSSIPQMLYSNNVFIYRTILFSIQAGVLKSTCGGVLMVFGI